MHYLLFYVVFSATQIVLISYSRHTAYTHYKYKNARISLTLAITHKNRAQVQSNQTELFSGNS